MVKGRKIFIAINAADHPVSVEIMVPDDKTCRLNFGRYEVLKEDFDESNP